MTGSSEGRRKAFRLISTVGLGVFAAFLLFILVSLHACDSVTYLQR